jgi:L-fucose isomerase-like protein
MRVGLIGTRPTAFQTVRFSEKLLQKSGITTVPVDLSEILAHAQSIDEKEPKLIKKVADIKAYGKVPSTIKEENILKQARFSVAIDEWCDKNDIDVSAIQCWNSLEENYGCAACLTMSMRGELKKPTACEADVCGAISMYVLTLATGNASALLDWNNNYGYEEDLCVNTHCSNYPRSFMGTDIEISNLDLLGETFGAERCFGAIKGTVQPGDMTFFRLSTDDTRGTIKAYVGEGEFVKKKFPMDGGIAVCKVERMRRLLNTICANGFEHHVAMVRSHAASIVYEAVSKYMGWNVYWHNAAEEEIAVKM